MWTGVGVAGAVLFGAVGYLLSGPLMSSDRQAETTGYPAGPAPQPTVLDTSPPVAPGPSGSPTGGPSGATGSPSGAPSGVPRSDPPKPPEPKPPAPKRPAPAVSDRFVSDLPFSRADNGLGPVERDRSNGFIGLGDGGPLSIAGVRFARGLGVHADSDVQVVLGGRCTGFTARIGVDDQARTDRDGDGTQVRFAVLADGKVIFRSPVLRRGDPSMTVKLRLGGVRRLDLVVDDLGFAFGDLADWADARVTCRA